MKIFINKDQ